MNVVYVFEKGYKYFCVHKQMYKTKVKEMPLKEK